MTESREIGAGVDHAAAVERFVDAIAGSRLRSLVVILFLALVGFLPGLNSIAVVDRDEARYLVETRLMVENGPAGQRSEVYGVRLPPVLFNWLEYASVSAIGAGVVSPLWVYRLPALCSAIAAVILTWWMALAFGRPRAALFAAILMATTPLLVVEAHLATADALLVAAVALSQGALARMWRGSGDDVDKPDFPLAFLFWSGLGIGVLVKGAIAPLVVGLTVAVLAAFGGSRVWLRRLAPLSGGLWFGAIIAAWYFVASWATGGVAAESALPARIAVQEAIEAPPGSYAVLFYPLFGPAGVFVALAIPAVVDRIGRPVFLFSVAWVAPFWLLMELWPVKLPHYILPAFPALALVGATAINEGWLRVTGWISAYFSLNLVVWPVLVGVGATVLFFLGEDRLPIIAGSLFLVAIVLGGFAFFGFYRSNVVVGSALLSVLSALLLYVGLFGIVVPGMTAIRTSDRLVAAGAASVSCSDPEYLATGYFEPSLVFRAGSDIRLGRPEEVAERLAEGGCKVAFVESRRQSIFNQRADDVGLALNVKSEIEGVNMGNWKAVKIRVFVVEEPTS